MFLAAKILHLNSDFEFICYLYQCVVRHNRQLVSFYFCVNLAMAKWRLFELVKQPSKMRSSLAALCRKRNTLKSVPVSLMLGHRMVFNKLIVDVQSVREVSVREVSIKSLSNVISLEPAVFDNI